VGQRNARTLEATRLRAHGKNVDCRGFRHEADAIDFGASHFLGLRKQRRGRKPYSIPIVMDPSEICRKRIQPAAMASLAVGGDGNVNLDRNLQNRPAFLLVLQQSHFPKHRQPTEMIDVETIFLGAMLNGLALATLLLFNAFPRAHRIANILLAALVGLLSLTMWNMFVLRSDQTRLVHLLDVYLWFTPLLWAPFVYLYVGQLTGLRLTTLPRVIRHGALGVFFGVLQIPLHLWRDTVGGQEWADILRHAAVALVYPQIALYTILSLRVLAEYRANAMQQVSTLARVNLRWLYAIIVIFAGFLAIDGSFNVPAAFLGTARPFVYDLVIVAEALAVFAIGYFSLRQPELIYGLSIEVPQICETSEEAAKYLGSPIDETLGAELANQVDEIMERDKVFLFNELTLADLAEAAGLSPHHLSQVINQHRQRNFYDYVNSYRAAHAVAYLEKHGKSNLTRLSFSSGFNNRASFNKAFKKLTGITPSSFVQSRSSSASTKRGEHIKYPVADDTM